MSHKAMNEMNFLKGLVHSSPAKWLGVCNGKEPAKNNPHIHFKSELNLATAK